MSGGLLIAAHSSRTARRSLSGRRLYGRSANFNLSLTVAPGCGGRAPRAERARRPASRARAIATPTTNAACDDPPVETMPRRSQPKTRKTPIRPIQLISMSMPRRRADLGQHQGDDLAHGEDGQRPAGQQLEVPADRRPRRAPRAGRRPGRAARPCASTGPSPGRGSRRGSRPRRSPGRAAPRRGSRPSPGEREHAEDRDRGQAHVADQVRDRPRAQRRAAAGLARQRAGAVDAEQRGASTAGGAILRPASRGSRPPARAASATSSRCSAPRAPLLRLDLRPRPGSACRPRSAAGSRAARRR